MPPRSSKHRSSRYDDPYTFDDPYIHSPPTAHNQTGYEYVGTDEPLSPRFGSPSRRATSPERERARRHARTTSPPRHSRHARTDSPPPRASRHSASPRPKGRHPDRALDGKKPPKGKHFYQDFAQQNPRLQQYGKQGLTWLGEAAAAYAAAQSGKDAAKGPTGDARRSRSVDRGDRSRRHHRRHASTPSPSPAPPRRHHSARHGDRDRDRDRDHDRARDHDRRRRYSTSPPPLSRDPDSYLASRHGSSRSRGRDPGHRHHHRRHHSPSPSPSPSRRSSHRHRSLHRGRNSTAPPPSTVVPDRWQMAARAAIEAGGLTAFRLRKEPGSWTGGKAAKVATAALGAAAMDAFMDQDPRGSRGGMKGMAENAISSLIASQIMGKGAKRRGRSRF